MKNFNEELKVWEGIKDPVPVNRYLGEEILRHLKGAPDRVAQIQVDGNLEVTYEEIRISSVRIAQNLLKRGIKSKDVVGVICQNSNKMTFLFNACVLIGAPVNPLDPSYTKNEIKTLFGLSLPKIVICEVDVFDKVQEALQELKLLSSIFVTSNSKVKGAENFENLMAPTGNEEDFESPKFEESVEEKVAVILTSSGTTGAPKGVKVSHAFIFSVGALTKDNTEPTTTLTFSTIYWGSGFFPHVLKAFNYNDTRIIARNTFNFETLIEAVEKYKVDDLFFIPYNLSELLNSDFPTRCNHKSLRTISCAGTIVSESLRKKFDEIFPDKSFLNLYGMSEIYIAMTLPGEFREPYSVGSRLMPNSTIKIVGDDGEKLGVGEIGEICIKSSLKFLGYQNNVEASEAAIDHEGFFKSGDLGYFNENGSLFLVDRIKEVWKYKRYTISPSEIENVIEKVEGVATVAAVGIPHDTLGCLSTAFVKKKKGFEDITEKEIQEHVAKHLPYSKQLHGGVFFVDDFPKTHSGKIHKRILIENFKKF